ncbi:MAG TPA: hypothetical protein DCP49_07390 [Erysipelotrichaceae bacterium]|nr:hypothetical protein [Erysipelotrichaceae bacterium]
MEKDRTLKALLSNKAVFASLINTFIFRQNHFVAPEQILFLAIQGKLQFDHNLHYFDRDVFAPGIRVLLVETLEVLKAFSDDETVKVVLDTIIEEEKKSAGKRRDRNGKCTGTVY